MRLTAAFGHWLAGLIAGEGCFRVHMARGGGHYACAFRIKLRDDDGPILREIHQRLGFGHVVPMRGPKTAFVAWDCESKKDCLELVRVLDRFPLRARKRADYAIWRKAVIFQMFRRRRGEWTEMIAYKTAIEAARFYRAPARLA